MKLLLPAALAFLTVACVAPAPPKPGTADHQRQLEKEAREHFYALKEQERRSPPPKVVARTAPAEKPRLKPFAEKPFEFPNLFARKSEAPVTKPEPQPRRTVAIKPAPQPRRTAVAKPTPKPKPSFNPFPWANKPSLPDDTVYFRSDSRRNEPDSPRYRAYKIKYARELAKRPEDLTSEEREWVRRHYRD